MALVGSGLRLSSSDGRGRRNRYRVMVNPKSCPRNAADTFTLAPREALAETARDRRGDGRKTPRADAPIFHQTHPPATRLSIMGDTCLDLDAGMVRDVHHGRGGPVASAIGR